MVDPRAGRFAAAVSAAIMALALASGTAWGVFPLAINTLVLAWATVFGPRYQPYGWLYTRVVKPRLGENSTVVDYRPLHLATALALGLNLLALISGLLGMSVVYVLVVGAALALALLHAIRGVCLGCRLYDQAQVMRTRVNEELRDVSVRL